MPCKSAHTVDNMPSQACSFTPSMLTSRTGLGDEKSPGQDQPHRHVVLGGGLLPHASSEMRKGQARRSGWI